VAAYVQIKSRDYGHAGSWILDTPAIQNLSAKATRRYGQAVSISVLGRQVQLTRDPELRRRWEQVQTEVDGQIELELLDLLRSNPCGALKQMTHLPSITKATQQRLSGELKGKQECGES
jgi:hypothetical protein